jgi:hypothetical protein
VRGSGDPLAVLAAYLAGIATTILALLVVATLLREGLARRLAPLAARLHHVSGLLLLAGGYLTNSGRGSSSAPAPPSPTTQLSAPRPATALTCKHSPADLASASCSPSHS